MPKLRKSRSRRSGFTLVELLIVIVAMVILAGMIIPEIGSSVEDAHRSAMLADLHELTSAIERYRIEHSGLPPDDLTGNSLPQLLQTTDGYGNLGVGPLGPYILNEIPVNPLTGSNKVVRDSFPPTLSRNGNAGWLYDPLTGQIWAAENNR